MCANKSRNAKKPQEYVIPISPKDFTNKLCRSVELGRRETSEHGGHTSPQFPPIRRHGT